MFVAACPQVCRVYQVDLYFPKDVGHTHRQVTSKSSLSTDLQYDNHNSAVLFWYTEGPSKNIKMFANKDITSLWVQKVVIIEDCKPHRLAIVLFAKMIFYCSLQWWQLFALLRKAEQMITYYVHHYGPTIWQYGAAHILPHLWGYLQCREFQLFPILETENSDEPEGVGLLFCEQFLDQWQHFF